MWHSALQFVWPSLGFSHRGSGCQKAKYTDLQASLNLTRALWFVFCEQRFFSCGVTSEHAHVRFFSEAFRKMIFELRRQRQVLPRVSPRILTSSQWAPEIRRSAVQERAKNSDYHLSHARPRFDRVEEAFGGGNHGLAQFFSKTLASMLELMKEMTEGGGDDMEAYMDKAQVGVNLVRNGMV